MNVSVIRSRRRTLSIEVNPDASVVVRAPLATSRQSIRSFITQKQQWIIRHQRLMRRRLRRIRPRVFEAGERFLFMGERYPLVLVERGAFPLVFEGEFRLIKYYREQAGQIFRRWYQQKARRILAERVREYAQVMGVEEPRVTITSPRHRWGSCNPNGRLCFNWQLIMAPSRVIDYVAVHELMHLKIDNHSRRFWRAVERVIPDYEECRRWLRAHEDSLVV